MLAELAAANAAFAVIKEAINNGGVIGGLAGRSFGEEKKDDSNSSTS